MKQTKEFPAAVVASLSSGRLLCDFSKLHECAEWIMGHPIWTHQFPALREDIEKTVRAQFPDMPTEIEDCNTDNWRERASAIEVKFGETLSVRRGGGHTALLPTDGIPDHLRDKTVIIET